jgi:hypothetical protein
MLVVLLTVERYQMSGNRMRKYRSCQRRKWVLPAPAILLIAMVSGCASTGPSTVPSAEPNQRPAGPPPSSARPVYNLAGYSPAFKDGYIDGCETAKKSAYGAKDARRMSGDSQYRLGWNDGFSLCSRK